VFVEKPFAMSFSGALRVVEAARERGLVVALGFNRRLAPSIRELERVLTSGELGTLQYIDGNFSGSYAYRYMGGMWRASKEESPVGGLMPMGIHVLDAMLSLAGPIEAVQTSSERRILKIDQDDTTIVTARFRCGITGTLKTITTTGPIFRLEVFGSKGWAMADGETSLRICSLEGVVTEKRFPAVDLERLELEAFSRAISKVENYFVSYEQALNGVATTDAIIESARLKAWVNVSPVT
jgi:predicted dehydrogenase